MQINAAARAKHGPYVKAVTCVIAACLRMIVLCWKHLSDHHRLTALAMCTKKGVQNASHHSYMLSTQLNSLAVCVCASAT